jgi:hypothetical protein
MIDSEPLNVLPYHTGAVQVTTASLPIAILMIVFSYALGAFTFDIATFGIPAYAQEVQEGPNEIFISRTTPPFPIIDGKWTVEGEWGRSTERLFIYDDDSKIAIRLAHDRENIYVLLDMVSDTTIDSGDKGAVCFDTSANGGKPDNDDYCFVAMPDGTYETYTGSADTFSATDTLAGVEMKAGISDAFDRYSKVSHMAYELKVSIGSLNRTDVFGFYTAVFDAGKKITYTWPIASSTTDDIDIKEPAEWGRMISPDKSIPEFPTAGIVFAISTVLAIITLKKLKSELWSFRYP